MSTPLLSALFRTEYRKVVSVLCRTYGLKHVEVAEDIASDTFLLAAETWGKQGVPENPSAWLYTVAKNRAKDRLKRERNFQQHIGPEIQRSAPLTETSPDFTDVNIKDSQLRMLFALSDPVIPEEARIGLSLRILCSFSIEEIADAFLTNKESINKRLFRAKEKLRSLPHGLEFPGAKALPGRLNDVLRTLYLQFNQGYWSATHSAVLRRDLCLESLRLALLLTGDVRTARPEVHALIALMCFHASRFNARFNDTGGQLLLHEQDRTLWDQDLIARGRWHLGLCSQGDVVTKYHLEAGIAHAHAYLDDDPEKWSVVLDLYDHLIELEPSPVAAMNRAYAVFRVSGVLAGVEALKAVDRPHDHLFHSLMGEIMVKDEPALALRHFQRALELAQTESDRRLIAAKMQLTARQ